MMIDTILDNGRILTCDTAYPQAQRIGLHRGRIIGVDGQLDGLTAQKTVNLDGAVVVPGFNDVHAHSVWFGLSMTELDLSAARTAQDVYTKVASKAESLPEGEWIIGANLELLNLASAPTLAGLDAAAPNHMLFLKSNSGHSGLVNSPVLARIRQSEGYSPEEGSGIVRDRHGNETGLLEENALAPRPGAVHALPAGEHRGRAGTCNRRVRGGGPDQRDRRRDRRRLDRQQSDRVRRLPKRLGTRHPAHPHEPHDHPRCAEPRLGRHPHPADRHPHRPGR